VFLLSGPLPTAEAYPPPYRSYVPVVGYNPPRQLAPNVYVYPQVVTTPIYRPYYVYPYTVYPYSSYPYFGSPYSTGFYSGYYYNPGSYYYSTSPWGTSYYYRSPNFYYRYRTW
jgi:hypothetical protein